MKFLKNCRYLAFKNRKFARFTGKLLTKYSRATHEMPQMHRLVSQEAISCEGVASE